MAGRKHGQGSRIYVGAFDFSGIMHAAEFNAGRALAETTSFLDPAYTGLPGKPGFSLKFGAFFDVGLAVGAGGWDEQMWTYLTSDSPVLPGFAPEGVAAGGVIYEGQEYPTDEPRKAQFGSALLLDADFRGTDPAARGIVLHDPNTAITAAGAKTGQLVGATIAGDQTVVTFRFLSVTGTGSITLAVEHSNDVGGTDPYASIATPGAIGHGSFPLATRIVVPGVTKAYKRLNVTAFTTITSATILVTVGPQPRYGA